MGSQFDLCVPIFKAMNSQIKLRKFSTEKNDLVGDDRRTAVNHLSRNHPLAQLLFSLEVWTYFLCTSVQSSEIQEPKTVKPQHSVGILPTNTKIRPDFWNSNFSCPFF